MHALRKAGRILLYTLLFLLVLLVILWFALQTTPVQNWLTQRVASYLEDTLETEVDIAAINWKLPKSVRVEGFYLEDQRGDTLAYLGELSAAVDLKKIAFDQIVELEELTAKSVYLNAYNTSERNNLQFLLDAFATDTTAAPVPVDTTATAMEIRVDNARILLEDIDIYYEDEPTGLLADVTLKRFEGRTDEVDLNAGIFKLGKLALDGADLKFTAPPATEDAEPTVLDYTIAAEELRITRTAVDADLGTLLVKAELEEAVLGGTEARLLGDSVAFSNAKFIVNNLNLDTDTPGATPQRGFDPNYLRLRDVHADIADIRLVGTDEFGIVVNSLSGRQESDARLLPRGAEAFVIENIAGRVAYTPDGVVVDNLRILTARTKLPGAELRIDYNFAGNAPLETLQLRADIPRADISIADILYFAPYLDSIAFLKENQRRILTLSAAASGSLADLRINRFNFNGLETTLRATGRVRYPTDPDRLSLNIDLAELSTTGDGIGRMLPPNTLPEYVELPARINARGTISGNTNRLNTNLVATTSRTGAAVSARLNGRVVLNNIATPDELTYDVALDTFFATRRELLAYLPPNTLPEDVTLPDELRLSGTAKGNLQNVTTDLRFQSVRGNEVSTAAFAGTINNFDDPDNIALDVSLESLDLKPGEVLAFLPPGTLPDYIQIPTIEDTKGRVKGSLDDLTADLTIFTSAGDLAIEGTLRGEQYDAEIQGRELTVQQFFKPGAYDTIVGLDLEPLELTFLAEGRGFDPYGDMNAKVTLQVQEESRDTRGILLNGVYAQREFDGTLVIEETEVELDADIFADLGANLPVVLADMHVDRLDLQALGITQTRFLAEAEVEARLVGFDPADTLYADLRIDSIRILDDSTLYLLDSIVSQARFVAGYNRAYLRSDVLRAEMDGRFDFATIGDRITKRIYSYIEPEVADTMTINSPPPNPDVVNFYLEVFNTELLTAGLIPGLEEMAPLFFNGGYHSGEEHLKLFGEIPHLVYSGLVVDTATIIVRGGPDSLRYDVDFAHLAYGDQIDIGRTEIDGGLAGERVRNALTTYDEKGDARLALTAFAGFEDGNVIVEMGPEQILNYNKWQVNPNNRLVVTSRAVTATDWEMAYNQQSIRLVNPAPEDLGIRFENFRLNTFSELINAQDSLFGGTLTGDARLIDLLGDPLYLADLSVQDVELYAGNLGNIDLDMRMDVPGIVVVDAKILGEGNDLSLTGEFRQDDPVNPLDFVLDINAIELPTLVKPAAEFLRAAEGQLTGRVDISGSVEQPRYQGRLQFQNAMINPALLNEPIRIGEEPIVFDGNTITINGLRLNDSQGGTASIEATITAESLTDFDLDIEFEGEEFRVLNTKPGDNELYYGSLVVNARATITGSAYEPNISAYVTPVSGDLVYLFPYYQVQNLEKAEGIVEFINPDAKVIDLSSGAQAEAQEVTDVIPMNLEVNIEMNDKVKFKAIMDPVTKDYFSGSGDGSITYTMDPAGVMGLTGRITLNGGEYLFTVPSTDFVKRLFSIEPNSYVQFFGDPFNPALDVWVRYAIETSPNPLVANQVQDVDALNLPDDQLFYARLNLNGTLESTNIDTDLDYPTGERNNTGNDQIEAAITALESDRSQMNTQVLGLITFNSFLSQSVSAVGIIGGNGGVGGGGLVYDLVADQLNNIANQYINFVDIEFGVDTYGDGGPLGLGGDRTDYRVTVKQQLFNDRLEIRVDGVTSNSSTPQPGTPAAQTYIDNLTLEYRVREDGSLRLKVFNKRDIDDFLGGEVIKLGGAAVFSKDFNRITLFDKRRNRKLITREPEPAPPLPDTD